MRNIKKFLALVLSVLMLAGCFSFTLGASSQFADVEEYNEAINVLTALNIVKGKDEFTFAPDDAVSRSQMAIFLARATSGWTYADNEKDKEVWKKDYTTSGFVDLIPGDYMGAIDYCYGFGYINGRSETIFDPNATVTFQEAMTMTVRALGYDTAAMQKGYPWTYIEKATTLGLDDELEDIPYDKALTRAETAQLIYNFIYTARINPDYINGVAGVDTNSKLLPAYVWDKFDYSEMTLRLDRTMTDGNKTFVYAYIVWGDNSEIIRGSVLKLDYEAVKALLCDENPDAPGTNVEFDYAAYVGRTYTFGFIGDITATEIITPIIAEECGAYTIYQNDYAYNVENQKDFNARNVTPIFNSNDQLVSLKLTNADGTTTVYNIVAEYEENTKLAYNQIVVYDSSKAVSTNVDGETLITYGQLSTGSANVARFDYLYKADVYDEDGDGYYDRVILFFEEFGKINEAEDYSGKKLAKYGDIYGQDYQVLDAGLVDVDIAKNVKVGYYVDVAIPAVVITKGCYYNDEGKYTYNASEIADFLEAETRIEAKLISYSEADATITVAISEIDREAYIGLNNVTFRVKMTNAMADFLYDNLGGEIIIRLATNFPNADQIALSDISVTVGDATHYIVAEHNGKDKMVLIGFDEETGTVLAKETLKKAAVDNWSVDSGDDDVITDDDGNEYVLNQWGSADELSVGDIVTKKSYKDDEDAAVVIVAKEAAEVDETVVDTADDFTTLEAWTDAAKIVITSDYELEVYNKSNKLTATLDYNPQTKILIETIKDNATIFDLESLSIGLTIDVTEFGASLAYLAFEDKEVKALYVNLDGVAEGRVIKPANAAVKTVEEIYVITDKTAEYVDGSYLFDSVFCLKGGYIDEVIFSKKYSVGDVIAIYNTNGSLTEKKLSGYNKSIWELASTAVKVDDTVDADIYENLTDLDSIVLYTIDDSAKNGYTMKTVTAAELEALAVEAGAVDTDDDGNVTAVKVYGVYDADDNTYNVMF